MPGRTQGTLFEIDGNRSTARNDSKKAVDSFCSAGNGRRPTQCTRFKVTNLGFYVSLGAVKNCNRHLCSLQSAGVQ